MIVDEAEQLAGVVNEAVSASVCSPSDESLVSESVDVPELVSVAVSVFVSVSVPLSLPVPVSVCTSPALGKFSSRGISASVVGVDVVGLLVSGRADSGAATAIGFDVACGGERAAPCSSRVFIGEFAPQATITVAVARPARLVLRKSDEQVLRRRRGFMVRSTASGHVKYIGFDEQT